ncbi:glycerophosphocholine phosphodiesterase GPCPD1-like [Amphibalanus amphitrite]|uniref:glycerophosphocholine phosphodiesterase GPCPD1-like n=1 Tax=Amphibalanus amphitrite TaxID=1232801 RepID=UPI001C920ACC|nr:glycerophosphocholine phosphodiesterase GPCPD1-like [Amphibalanus amphitrite]
MAPPVSRQWQFSVTCEVDVGETVCLVGSAAQLGSWCLGSVVELQRADPVPHFTGINGANGVNGVNGVTGTNGARRANVSNGTTNGTTETEPPVWRTSVTLRTDQDVFYRYCVCMLLHVDGQRKVVARRWETDLAPRKIPAAALQEDDTACDQLDHFGCITPMRHVDRGWLSVESVVQLKLYANPVELWKKRQRKYRLKVTPVNLERKMIAEPLMSSEDSSEMDMQSLRAGNTWPVMELAVMKEGENFFQRQQQFGRVYEEGDFFTFQCQMLKPETIAYMVDLYSAENTDGESAEHIGFCHILPNNLKQTNGTVSMPINGTSQQPIGQLTVDYLLVRPMEEAQCMMENSYSRYWRETWRGLDVGHRGAGNSFTHKPEACANIRENTIASLKQAMEHGADFVEFDIQLSKDMVPLIYHDFHVGIALRKKDVIDDHHLLTVPLKDLEYAQLQQLKVYNIEEGKMGSLHLENDLLEDNQPFPTLQLAMESLDPHLGFNIEIKWTMQLQDGSFELCHPFELNSYIDHILKVVLEHSGTRKIIFSCFHPDICTMLRLKQNRYPVLFLTQGETDQWPPYKDTRCQSLDMAQLFARSAQILGVDVFSGVLLKQPEYIKSAQAKGLVVFCWGDDNANSDTIRYLKAQGCDGIIYDRMDRYCEKDNKESIFLMEARQAKDMALADSDNGSDASAEEAPRTATGKGRPELHFPPISEVP